MKPYMMNFSPGHSIFHPQTKSEFPQGGTAQIVSKKQKIPLTKNDQFIFMDWRSPEERENLEYSDWFMFKYNGKLKSNGETRNARREELNIQEQYEYDRTRQEKYLGDPAVYYIHDFDVEFTGTFETNKYLDDYTFSLKGIYNYSRPQSHFTRRFTNLDKFDFETLINERIYSSRTVLGRLFYSLPRENQLEFTLLAMEQFETSELSSVSLIEGVKFLNEYTKRITGLGQILIETNRILNKSFSNIIDIESVGFAFERIKKNRDLSIETEYLSDTISDQAKLFSKAFELEDSVAKTIDLVTTQGNTQLENQFKQKFIAKSWPIQINL